MTIKLRQRLVQRGNTLTQEVANLVQRGSTQHQAHRRVRLALLGVISIIREAPPALLAARVTISPQLGNRLAPRLVQLGSTQHQAHHHVLLALLGVISMIREAPPASIALSTRILKLARRANRVLSVLSLPSQVALRANIFLQDTPVLWELLGLLRDLILQPVLLYRIRKLTASLVELTARWSIGAIKEVRVGPSLVVILLRTRMGF